MQRSLIGVHILVCTLISATFVVAEEIPPELERFYALDELIGTAYSEGKNEEVRFLCFEYLYWAEKYRRDWNYGNAIHKANMYLGLVSLRSGDIDSALAYVTVSSKTSGSPQLNSFGPNLSLAKALLEQHHVEPVLKYLDEVKRFWELENGQLEKWKQQIQSGHIPDFGPNLKY
jgi:hypothetical protein